LNSLKMKKLNNFLNDLMKTQSVNNLKVGAFVTAGLVALMVALYMIGSNRSVFGSNFELKVHFKQLSGLTEGSNVLFSGLQAGTVKNVNMINDTTIEVVLIIDSKIKNFIHKNALVSIGSDGLMGNKVVNIINTAVPAIKVGNGDLLATKKSTELDAMIQKLSKTNDNVEVISEILRKSLVRVDSSSLLDVLSDHELGPHIKGTLINAEKTSVNAMVMSQNLNWVVTNILKGKGTVGMLLSDTGIANNIKVMLYQSKAASINAEQATARANDIIKNLQQEINSGNGSLHALLKDSLMARNLEISMENIKKGTAGFNDNMEALKHNFLLRGFFTKRENLKQDSLKKARVKSNIN